MPWGLVSWRFKDFNPEHGISPDVGASPGLESNFPIVRKKISPPRRLHFLIPVFSQMVGEGVVLFIQGAPPMFRRPPRIQALADGESNVLRGLALVQERANIYVI